jgi:hypothetical protein
MPARANRVSLSPLPVGRSRCSRSNEHNSECCRTNRHRPSSADVAKSWAHPGENVTGNCLIAAELEVKRLSLLHEALPSVHQIAVMSAHRRVVEAGGRTGTGRSRAQTNMQPPLARCAVMALWQRSVRRAFGKRRITDHWRVERAPNKA